jgi:hypothetical protein
LLLDALTQEKLDVRLGKEVYSVKIARAKTTMTEPPCDSKPIEEVKGVLLFNSPESLLKDM